MGTAIIATLMVELGSHAHLAFAAGPIFVMSPCVLPLMPVYLSLVSGISVEEMQVGAFARIKLHFRKLEIATGSVLMAVGVLSLTNQFSAPNSKFGFMASWVAAAEKAIQ